MISSSEIKNAIADDWMTLAPQSGPIVVTSKLSVVQPKVSATSFAVTVASSAEVVVVRTRKPGSPSAVVVWMTASGSPASLNASRTCSVVTSPVPWKVTDVPPTNSMPKFMPRTPTMMATSTIAQHATVRKVFLSPRRLMSSLMKRPRTSLREAACFTPWK